MNLDGDMTLAERALASMEGKGGAPLPRHKCAFDGQGIGSFLRDYARDNMGEVPVNIGPHIEQWFSITANLSQPEEFARCDQLGIAFAELPFAL